MTPSRLRRLRCLITAIVAAISLLFAQMAVASYACPGLRSAEAMQAMAAMAHCSGMDAALPGLCKAHNHVGQQSLDKPDVPDVAPFQPGALVLTIAPPQADGPAPVRLAAARLLAHATAPPVAILHCCFRI